MSRVVGITGRSGSGKSTFSRILESMGYEVIDCDRLSREVQCKGSSCLREMSDAFGNEILLDGGELDRRRLADICFADSKKHETLNAITHKYILALLRERIMASKSGICFFEAGALFESGADRMCDAVVSVIACHERSVERIAARDRIDKRSIELRLGAQLTNDELIGRSDFVIYNDFGLSELENEAKRLIISLNKKFNLEVDMEKEKTAAELLADKVMLKRKSCFELMSDAEKAEAKELAKRYMDFLTAAKTERECVDEALKLLAANGYSEFDSKKSYKAGDKVYFNNRGKALITAVVGKRSLEENGMRIVASHTDCPRLDLKPYPLYEDSEIAFFKTHYYGGIKKYQWTNIALAIHGVVIDKDGKSIEIKIGEDIDDPVFYITNLLPHLSASHNTRTGRDIIKGEELNIVIGSEPFDFEAKDAVKLNAMKLINEKYGITEKDFISAELEIVPANRPRYVGFDRSFIGAYGHDDRICAYQSLEAVLTHKAPENTCLCIFADKEETGSDGSTGMSSDGLKNFMTQLTGCVEPKADIIEVIKHSKCLSTDVTAALDPTFSDVSDRKNASYANYGVSVDKYGGSGGKYGCNDATAEYMGIIKNMLDRKGICWQTGELGKIDEGGGGTVAKFISALGIDTVDCGVPLLSMHSPFELASVLDTYSFYQCCKEFFNI